MERIVKIVDRTSAHTLAALDDHAQGDRTNLIPVRRDALFKAVERETRPRGARRAFVYRLPGDECDQLSRQHYCFRLRINKHGRHHLFLSLLDFLPAPRSLASAFTSNYSGQDTRL